MGLLWHITACPAGLWCQLLRSARRQSSERHPG